MTDEDVSVFSTDESSIIPIVGGGVRPEFIIQSYRFGMHSDVGQARSVNEDSALALALARVAHLQTQPVGLFMVADGMGGHEAGEEASFAAVQSASESLLREVIVPMTDSRNVDGDSTPISEAMTHAFEAAHQRVMMEFPSGATTLTAALLVGRRIYVGHAGDCRLYVRNGPVFRPLTRDHSVLSRLVELEHLEGEEVEALASDPRRNVLYRAIGQTEELEFDFFSRLLEPGDTLLLCSDGLWGTVPDEIARGIMADSDTPDSACRRLVDEANRRGGPDNITAIIIEPVEQRITD
jgi:PPM family protein phosphatase